MYILDFPDFFDFPGFHMSSYTLWISLIFYIFSEFIMIFIYILDFHDIQIYFGIFLDFSEFQTISIWILVFPGVLNFTEFPMIFIYVKVNLFENPGPKTLGKDNLFMNPEPKTRLGYIFFELIYILKNVFQTIFSKSQIPLVHVNLSFRTKGKILQK